SGSSGRPIAILAGVFIVSRFGSENLPHVDQIVGDHTQSDPPSHTILTAIPAPIQSVPAFQNTDSTFAAGSPLLTSSKPASLLKFAQSRIFGRAIWNRNMLHTHLLDRGFLSWRMKGSIGCNQVRNLPEPFKMLFHSIH